MRFPFHRQLLLFVLTFIVADASGEVPHETRQLVDRLDRDIAYLIDGIAIEEFAAHATSDVDRSEIDAIYNRYLRSLEKLDSFFSAVPARLTRRTRIGLSEVQRIDAMRDRERAMLRAKASAQRSAREKQLDLLDQILDVPSIANLSEDVRDDLVNRILFENRRRVHRANNERRRSGIPNDYDAHPYLPDLLTSLPAYETALALTDDEEGLRSQVHDWTASYNTELDINIRRAQLEHLADSPLIGTEHVGVFFGGNFQRERRAAFARSGKTWASWYNLNDVYMMRFYQLLAVVDPAEELAMESRRAFEAAYAEALYDEEFVDVLGDWIVKQHDEVIPIESEAMAIQIIDQYKIVRAQWQKTIFRWQVDDKCQYGVAGHRDSNQTRIDEVMDTWRNRQVVLVEQLMNLIPKPEREAWLLKWHAYAASHGIKLNSTESIADEN
jgi:hypothetical protein